MKPGVAPSPLPIRCAGGLGRDRHWPCPVAGLTSPSPRRSGRGALHGTGVRGRPRPPGEPVTHPGRGRAGRSGRGRHRPPGLRSGSRGRVTPLLGARRREAGSPRGLRRPSPPRGCAGPAGGGGGGGREGQAGEAFPARSRGAAAAQPQRRGKEGGGKPGRWRRGAARDPHLAGAAAGRRPGSRRARRLGARRPLGARTHTLRRCGPASGRADTPLPAPGGATAPPASPLGRRAPHGSRLP